MEDIFEELAADISDDENNQTGPREDEAIEVNDGAKRLVKPKRTISQPRPKLDSARLLGNRGIFTLGSAFEEIKFKGKGSELDDLNNVLSRLQHWAHRLFPKMTFEDCIDKIEALGSKREILTNMHKLRMGMIDLDSLQVPSEVVEEVEVVENPFDQIMGPPAPTVRQATLTDEQRATMMRNRLLAEEKRMARRLAREKELEEEREAALTALSSPRDPQPPTPTEEELTTDPPLAAQDLPPITNSPTHEQSPAPS